MELSHMREIKIWGWNRKKP